MSDSLMKSGDNLPTVHRAPSNAMPEGLSEDSIVGLKLPYIKLASSRMADNKKPEGVVNGDYFNEVTQENYGPQFYFVPIKKFLNRFRTDKDLNMKCISNNAKTGTPNEIDICDCENGCQNECSRCSYAKWTTGPDGKKMQPVCNLVQNYISAITKKEKTISESAEDLDVAVTRFYKQSSGCGSLIDSAVMIPPKPLFSIMYKMDSMKKTHPKFGDYIVPVVQSAGKITDESTKDQLRSLYTQLAGHQQEFDVPVEESF